MNEVSDRSPPADSWPLCTASATRGSAAAAEATELRISPGSLVNSTDRKTAVPSVPPICRKKVTDEVATPISRGLTAFCTARMTGWKLKPEPEAQQQHERHQRPHRGVGGDDEVQRRAARSR